MIYLCGDRLSYKVLERKLYYFAATDGRECRSGLESEFQQEFDQVVVLI
jgi:hypothetical protein